jgi:capsular polysaccharide biosynthesis protein
VDLKLLVPEGYPQWIFTFLELLQVPAEAIVRIKDYERFYVHTLFFCKPPEINSHKFEKSSDLRREAYERVNAGLSKVYPLEVEENAMQGSRLAFLRTASDRRYITNTTDLKNILQAHGFRIVELDQCTLTEQLALVGGADILLFETGAAMSVLGFSNASVCIELAHPFFQGKSTVWDGLSEELNIRHIKVETFAEDHMQEGAIAVNLPALEKCLEALA